ncbi:MAG: flagellar hook-basal body complex protein FliE [Geminicoccaceae bacterium]|nr:flagellar hook-basal body complex protein FliE [Geminicoccaceae bacterium]MCB2009827.1 flagellar hook-basal body complex protein FliE [Geminicoccaceae bacterium]
MTTPVSMQAVGAYRAAMKRLEAAGQPVAQEQVQPSSFETLLRSEITGSIGKLKGAEQASIAALTGNASTQQVVEALTAAELSLQKVTAVRDRVISAYQEVIRMPI